jgi:hypothetical protein
MIAATATFAVFRHEPATGIVRVLTVLTDLADGRSYDATAPALPTYAEAVRIVIERGLAPEPRIGFLKHFGVAEFVPLTIRQLVPELKNVGNVCWREPLEYLC